MQNKSKVQLLQLNNNYGNQYYLPYTIGCLQAYVHKHENIRNNFEFLPFLYKRERVETVVAKMGHVDVFGVSSYVWNWRLSLEIAKELRRRNPNVLIIFGGPHVPDIDPEFFKKFPFIDIAVHGEGELAFLNILETYLRKESFHSIPNTSYFNRITGEVHHNSKGPRFNEIDLFPSPYLEGAFKPLMESVKNVEWMAMWETNRGCPFACSFCDWGSAIASKVNDFDIERLKKEINWFSKNKIGFILGADANFGIRKRDLDIAHSLANAKNSNGYPNNFYVSHTKNSTKKIFDVAKVLCDAKMSKGVCLAMQSMNKETLISIKRDNISLGVFHELQTLYNQEGIPTFTELILGLPMETYQSFTGGIEQLIENGQHSQIFIYNCTVMPNAEIGEPAYQKKYGIKTVNIPIFTAHSTPSGPDDSIVEYEPIVIGSDSMDVHNWRRTYHFAWMVQCFHTLGLLQHVAIFLRYYSQVSYKEFYESLIKHAISHPETLVGSEIKTVNSILDGVLQGKGFDQYIHEFSDISWPMEEASLIRLSLNIDQLYIELTNFIKQFIKQNKISINNLLVNDLIRFQKELVVQPDGEGTLELNLCADIPGFIQSFRNGKQVTLNTNPITYKVERGSGFGGDKKKYAHEVVWFGRKGGKFFYPFSQIQNSSSASSKALLTSYP